MVSHYIPPNKSIRTASIAPLLTQRQELCRKNFPSTPPEALPVARSPVIVFHRCLSNMLINIAVFRTRVKRKNDKMQFEFFHFIMGLGEASARFGTG